MSLFKQIQLLMTLLLVVTLAIVLKTNFDSAQEFAANQLFNTGKNVANVLALSLGSQASDPALMETTINAMFDGGHFEEITLARQNGTVVYQKKENVVIDGVPALFIKHVDLHSPIAIAQISSGWSIFGTIRVKGHPGPFYISLWETFRSLCILFVMLAGLVISASYLILRLLLRSLAQIQLQAEAISNHEFVINETIPRTPELKKVVLAMNTMVEKVQQIFNRQLDSIKYYKEMQFKDALTGLHNRNYFVKQLGQFLDSDNENASGQMAIISMAGMEKSNISTGHPIIQGIYKGWAEILRKETRDVTDVLLARLSQNEFSVILPNCSLERGRTVAESVVKNLTEMVDRELELKGLVIVNGGMAPYAFEDSVGSVLSKADYALSSAKSGLPGTLALFQEKQNQAVLGKFEWKTMIDTAFSDGRFFLTAQPVISDKGEYHKELYINLKDPQGNTHRAGYFMPMAISLGQAGRIDRFVLETAAAYLGKTSEGTLAVNITTEFCKDRLALIWLRQFLEANKAIRTRLVIEMHDSTLIQHPDVCLDLAGMLRGMRYGFGIDQYTMNDVSLDLLKEMNPNYIKIESDYLQDKDNRSHTEMALNAILTITDSLGIELIATRIETEAQRQALVAKNITCFQGHGIAGIGPLEG